MKTNKKIAAAIKYEDDQKAPKVIGKGYKDVANRIIEVGKEKNIEIIQNEELAKELMNIDINEYIPEDLYEVVAEILIFVTNLDKI